MPEPSAPDAVAAADAETPPSTGPEATGRTSRRTFLKQAGSLVAASTVGFPSIWVPDRDRTIGVALCGLGNYSTGQLAPGLQRTEHCELRGIVTGSPEKISVWQRRHGIPDRNVYSYETLPDIANNDAIDVVYIVTPPGVHARDAIKAAEAGKHVWCEKPMAMDAEECQAIIDAADQNDVQLTVGYRLQHEPNNRTIMRYAEEATYGAVERVETGAGYSGAHPDPDDWRRDAELGGGALYDMGVYPINAARYATGMEPVAVRGRTWSERDQMYSEVPEFATFTLEFPGGVVAKGETSFGKSTNYLDVTCTDGSYQLRPFQTYSGVQGQTSDGTRLRPSGRDQQARQMDNDARAIKNGEAPVVPGEEGLADIRIVNAIMKSDRQDGARIEL
jgi:glucose-fructose oxidoreductase